MTKVYRNRVFIKVKTMVGTVQLYGMKTSSIKGVNKWTEIVDMPIDVLGFISRGGQ